MQVLLAGMDKGSETKGPYLEFQIDVSSLPTKLLKQITSMEGVWGHLAQPCILRDLAGALTYKDPFLVKGAPSA